MSTALDYALKHLDTTRGFTLAMLKDVPEGKLTAQFPGAANHFLWTMGHMATGYAFFGSAIGTKLTPLPESYNTLFGWGSQPKNDPGIYPSLTELLSVAGKAYSEVRAHAATLTEAQLASKALAGDGFLASQMDAILMLAWHEGWHSGQLSASRRALGLKGVMG